MPAGIALSCRAIIGPSRLHTLQYRISGVGSVTLCHGHCVHVGPFQQSRASVSLLKSAASSTFPHVQNLGQQVVAVVADAAASVGSQYYCRAALCQNSVVTKYLGLRSAIADAARQMQFFADCEVKAHLMRQAAGVIRDYRKVVQGVQEPDTCRQLIRISAKGQGDVATIHRHSASVHHHKTYTLAAVNYDSIACSTGSPLMVLCSATVFVSFILSMADQFIFLGPVLH